MNKLSVFGVCALSIVVIGCGGSAEAPLLSSSNPPSNSTGTTTPAGPTSQSITFSTTKVLLGETTVVASTDSSLPITYESQTPAICTILGAAIKGEALGACTIKANQAGNTSYSAAPEVIATIDIVSAQSINPFVIPPLTVGMRAVLNPTATSNRPVLLVSQTPATCAVDESIIVRGVRSGNCTLLALQLALQPSYNSRKFADAPSLLVSTTVVAANTSLTPNAVLAPWITTPLTSPAPQLGSTAQDATTSIEGLYSDESGGVGLIDSANNIQYSGNGLLLSGSIIQDTSSTWSLNSSSAKSVPQLASITANGTFVVKTSFTATAQSFLPTTPLSLVYSIDNGFAASQSSVSGDWLYSDGGFQYQLNISPSGAITGKAYNLIDAPCTLSGTIQQAAPSTQHNLYRISLTAANESGSLCVLGDGTGVGDRYTGLAALSFSAAGNSPSNGYLLSLSVVANNPLQIIPFAIKFFRL